MADRVLVTGGSGFIGSSLVKKLVYEGYTVRVLDDNSRGNLRRLKSVLDDVEFIQGDVRDAELVDSATKGVDIMAHLAFVNGTEFFYTKPKLVLEVGVKGALNTLDSAIRHGCREYWGMSSSEVYQRPPVVPTDETVGFSIPNPLNPRYSYAGGKIISELLAINYGRDTFERTVLVRPHNVYGPDMGWEHVIPEFILRAHKLASEQPTGTIRFPIQGDGTQTRSFDYIDDFTEGCFLAFSKGEKLGIYHVGSMEEMSIADVVRDVVALFGREAELVPGKLPEGGTDRRCPDTAKIEALGHKPKISFAEGLRRTAEWYVANLALAPA